MFVCLFKKATHKLKKTFKQKNKTINFFYVGVFVSRCGLSVWKSFSDVLVVALLMHYVGVWAFIQIVK